MAPFVYLCRWLFGQVSIARYVATHALRPLLTAPTPRALLLPFRPILMYVANPILTQVSLYFNHTE